MQSDKPSFLPFSRPSIGDEEIAEVVACLKSGWITTGPRCERLENDFKAATGAKHALALSSCTAAQHVAYLAVGCGPGDEVIVPALTWASTANMVVATGAKPVFADSDPVTWNIDPASVAKLLTKKTKAVVPVHYAGQPADLDAIHDVLDAAGRQDVVVVEDAAHGAGAAYKGRPIGACAPNRSAAVCFSFHPIKNMTTAEGAIVTTDDDALAKKMKLWKFHGVERDAWKAYAGGSKPATSYDVVLPGFKYNLTDLHAALGIHQFAKLAGFNKRRGEIAARYAEGLAGTPGLTLPGRAKYDVLHPWHLYVVLVPPGTRATFIERMNALGVGTGIHFEAVHTATYYREHFGGREGQCPVAEDVCSRCVSLPIYPNMSEADVDRSVAAVKEALRACG